VADDLVLLLESCQTAVQLVAHGLDVSEQILVGDTVDNGPRGSREYGIA
jgi:hypothetical protein